MMPLDDHTYENVTFDKVVFNDALESIEFYNCTFVNVSFQSCRLEDCCFDGCEFHGCNLSLIEIQQTSFLSARFTDCKLLGISWNSVRGLLSAEFNRCILDSNIFSDMNLTKFHFVSCSFSEASFFNTKLMHAVFDDCDMHSCQFSQSNLSHADFTTSRDYFISATTNILHKTKFSLPEAAALLANLDIVLE